MSASATSGEKAALVWPQERGPQGSDMSKAAQLRGCAPGAGPRPDPTWPSHYVVWLCDVGHVAVQFRASVSPPVGWAWNGRQGHCRNQQGPESSREAEEEQPREGGVTVIPA